MDDIQLILYIIFLVGYFIFKMVTGKGKPVTRQDPEKFDQHPDHGHEHHPYDPPTGRPKTLEDIFGELIDHRSIEKNPETPKQVEETIQDSWYDNPEETYQYPTIEQPVYSTIDEQINLDDLDTSIGEVEHLEEAEERSSPVANPYLGMFSNMQDAKRAIVMSEILNRKY